VSALRPEADPSRSEFGRIYEEHVWRVYAFLSYRSSDPLLAEDLTQATFERALRAFSRFDPRRGSELAWLLTIARNLLVDHVRGERSVLIDPLDERLDRAVAGPEARFSGSPELVEAIAQLDERDREVLALRFGGDLSGPEIAAVMQLTLANVQQITSRALRRLRALLEEARAGER
jgi:RNA polymerase sigma-70 factor (ECF subfamily)